MVVALFCGEGIMREYTRLLIDVLFNGETRGDRTGTGTYSVFGRQGRFDLTKGFPLLTVKRVPFKSVAAELLWFIAGGTNIRSLLLNGCTIWTDWPLAKFRKETNQPDYPQSLFEENIVNDREFAEQWGDLGPVYGKQWRNWDAFDPGSAFSYPRSIDQLDDVIERIKHNPECRRLLVSAWNPGDVGRQALPPCHYAFQFYCHRDGGLSLHMNMRSTDIFLGLPFNIASYALLTHMVAGVTGRTAKELVISFGDLHLYANHVEQAHELLGRTAPALPQLGLTRRESIDDYTLDDLTSALVGYNPLKTISAPVAV
jgi:thymidylate synthase